MKSGYLSSLFNQTKDDALEEKDPEKASELNDASSSCQQFKLSIEEEMQLAEYNKKKEEIAIKMKELISSEKENSQDINKVTFCDDLELTELLTDKIAGHEITCSINRTKKIVTIVIKDCEKTQMVKDIFGSLLKETPQIKSAGSVSQMNNHSRVIVSLKLRDRDQLIKGLSLSKEIYRLPEAAKHFEGC